MTGPATKSNPVLVYDREQRELRPEKVFGGGALRFFYGGPLGRVMTWVLFKRRPFSWLYGCLQRRSRGAAARIEKFVQACEIDVAQYEKPLDAYPTLDAFFTRRFRDGARPVDPQEGVATFGAEGRVLVYPVLEADRLVPVKGRSLRIGDLLGDRSLGERYAGGTVVVIRIAPADYHRFHFPEAGVPTGIRRVGGSLHSVTPIALESGADVFGGNERHISTLATDAFGEILLVEVGAMLVGRIVQTYQPDRPVERCQEKGYFAFGGSTVIYVFEAGRIGVDGDLVEQSAAGQETLVRLGTRMGEAR